MARTEVTLREARQYKPTSRYESDFDECIGDLPRVLMRDESFRPWQAQVTIGDYTSGRNAESWPVYGDLSPGRDENRC